MSTALSMIFDARKSAENSKQVRETNAATSRPPDAKRSSPDSGGAVLDTPGLRSEGHDRTAEVRRADVAQTDRSDADYLGLRVERQADHWRVTWNRNVSANSVQGRLSFTDGFVRKNLELRSNELQTGAVCYSYSPETDDIFLCLEITGSDSPIPISESVRLTAASASPLARRGGRTVPQRGRGAARITRTRPGKVQETKDTGAYDFASVRSLTRKPRSEFLSAQVSPQSGSAFEPAKLIAGSSPVYPATVAQRFVSEKVEVSFRISPEGKVYNVKWLNGPPILAQAAAEAVESWQYEPGRLNGAPIDSQSVATVNFNQG